VERHGSQRARVDAWVSALERDARSDPAELREARARQVDAIRRAALFEAQGSVIEGKERAVVRRIERVGELKERLEALAEDAGLAGVRRSTAPGLDPAAILRAQEELRRDISRRMHDGPAQSLASIALQVEVVERLASRGDPRAAAELHALRTLVQGALDTTKAFIFEVRPMVLDDLGLLPTLRRLVIDRADRAGIPVEIASSGVAVRLHPDLESGIYRIIAEAASGLIRLQPEGLEVRLTWTDGELEVLLGDRWTDENGSDAGELAADLPPALQAMIAGNRAAGRAARASARSLPEALVAELGERARMLGIQLQVRPDGAGIAVRARIG